MNPQLRRFIEQQKRKQDRMPVPTNAARADWDAIASQLDPNTVPTQGYLRSEVQNLGATSGFTFTFNTNSAASVTENRLQNNDAFLASHISVALSIRLTADPVSTQDLLTFPNGQLLTTAASLNAARTFFNGRLAVRMNDKVMIDSLDLLSFLRADYAQRGQAISTAVGTGVQSASFWGQDSSFKALTPNLLFNGTARNEIVVSLPEAATFTLALNTIGAVCIMRGWLLQNGGIQRQSR